MSNSKKTISIPNFGPLFDTTRFGTVLSPPRRVKVADVKVCGMRIELFTDPTIPEDTGYLNGHPSRIEKGKR